MPLPKSFTKVTRFSKILALCLFIVLPIAAFYYGISYEKETQADLPNPFCKNWIVTCDPTDPGHDVSNGCIAKKMCADSSPTPTDIPVDNPNLKIKIDRAKDDLIKRLHTSVVQVVFVKKVNWTDGSLGCPKSGVMYTQVITEGYEIIFTDENKKYYYHASVPGDAFLCEILPAH